MPKPSEATDQNTDKQDAPMSIRESIMAAKTELEEGPDDTDDQEEKEEKEGSLLDDDFSDDPAGEGLLKETKGKKAETEETEPEEIEASDDKEVKKPLKAEKTKEVKQEKIAAPDNWKDTAEWDKTPASVRQKIIKREEEVSNGFKQYGAKAQEFDKYEQFIGPRRQSMAKIGVTPEQVIGRALDWMDALGHPDPKVKSESFKLLARNFGQDINQLAGVDNSGGESFRVGSDSQGELPPQVREHISNLENKLAHFEQQLGGVVNTFQSEKDRNAAAYLQDWSKDKPYFQSVQPKMVQLIQSGTVPLKDGMLDLDAAYKMACEADPQMKRLMELEGKEKARAEAKAKADKERKNKQQRTQSARDASSSLKTGASSASMAKNDGRGMSIRDSIRLAQQELNGG